MSTPTRSMVLNRTHWSETTSSLSSLTDRVGLTSSGSQTRMQPGMPTHSGERRPIPVRTSLTDSTAFRTAQKVVASLARLRQTRELTPESMGVRALLRDMVLMACPFLPLGQETVYEAKLGAQMDLVSTDSTRPKAAFHTVLISRTPVPEVLESMVIPRLLRASLANHMPSAERSLEFMG